MLKTKGTVFKLWIILSMALAITAMILCRPQYLSNDFPLFLDLIVTPIFVVGFSVFVSALVQVIIAFLRAKKLYQLSFISVLTTLSLSYLVLVNTLVDVPKSLLMFFILGSIATISLHFGVGLMLYGSQSEGMDSPKILDGFEKQPIEPISPLKPIRFQLKNERRFMILVVVIFLLLLNTPNYVMIILSPAILVNKLMAIISAVLTTIILYLWFEIYLVKVLFNFRNDPLKLAYPFVNGPGEKMNGYIRVVPIIAILLLQGLLFFSISPNNAIPGITHQFIIGEIFAYLLIFQLVCALFNVKSMKCYYTSDYLFYNYCLFNIREMKQIEISEDKKSFTFLYQGCQCHIHTYVTKDFAEFISQGGLRHNLG